MKIALISEHASPLATLGGVDAGGQNTYVACVASYLVEAGHQVDVLTRRDARQLAPIVTLRPGLRVIHVPAGPPEFVPKERLLPYMRDFVNATERMILNGEHYDIVHANFFMSGLVALQLKERFGLPFVMSFHALGRLRNAQQGEADTFPKARMEIEQRLVERADRILAECPQDEHDLVNLYDADPQRISMVPCGVDLYQFRPMDKLQARARLGLKPGDFIALHVGRIVPRKGIDNIVQSLALLDDRIPARLVVVGGDTPEPDEAATPEIKCLRDIAHSCGVADRVEFTGHRERADLRVYYAAADVLVTTPWYEPFGITPLEAMACATPVIGSAVGGIQYTVLDGVTGYLVPPRHPQGLARYLAMLHDNPAMAQALGRAGMRRVRSKFTWDRVTSDLINIYSNVEAMSAQPPWSALAAGTIGAMPATVRLDHGRAPIQGYA